MVDLFCNGMFVIIYFFLCDYYRVYMLCNGILCEMIYVLGDFFFVNYFIVQNVLNLFVCNECVICLFDIEFGLMVQILVGATIVGSIEMVWVGIITSLCEGIIKCWIWFVGENDGFVALLKGQEMGRFKFGFIVINLFVSGKVNLVE